MRRMHLALGTAVLGAGLVLVTGNPLYLLLVSAGAFALAYGEMDRRFGAEA